MYVSTQLFLPHHVAETANHATHTDWPGKQMTAPELCIVCQAWCSAKVSAWQGKQSSFLNVHEYVIHLVTIDRFHAVWEATCYFLSIMVSSALLRASAAAEGHTTTELQNTEGRGCVACKLSAGAQTLDDKVT